MPIESKVESFRAVGIDQSRNAFPCHRLLKHLCCFGVALDVTGGQVISVLVALGSQRACPMVTGTKRTEKSACVKMYIEKCAQREIRNWSDRPGSRYRTGDL